MGECWTKESERMLMHGRALWLHYAAIKRFPVTSLNEECGFITGRVSLGFISNDEWEETVHERRGSHLLTLEWTCRGLPHTQPGADSRGPSRNPAALPRGSRPVKRDHMSVKTGLCELMWVHLHYLHSQERCKHIVLRLKSEGKSSWNVLNTLFSIKAIEFFNSLHELCAIKLPWNSTPDSHERHENQRYTRITQLAPPTSMYTKYLSKNYS